MKRIKKIFKKQAIIEQYRVEKYFIDIFFPVHKLGIEIDENGHLDRSEIKEQYLIQHTQLFNRKEWHSLKCLDLLKKY